MTSLNQSTIDLVKQFEGCRLQAYQDQAGVWTIGYGHTGGVGPMDYITLEQAEQYLRDDLAISCEQVQKLISVPLNDNQFGALVDFTYNEGSGRLLSSTMRKLLDAGDYDAAAKEFPKWDIAAGKVDAGLLRRRLAEQALFMLPEATC